MQHYVYLYRDPSNGWQPFYVGKGSGKRWRDHFRGHSSNEFMQSKMARLKAQGVTPLVETIEAIDEQHAYFLEECLIDVIGRRIDGSGPLVNLSTGGKGGTSGVRRSPETRAKMGAASRSRRGSYKLSESTRARISEAHVGLPGPNVGRKFGPRARVCCVRCRKDVGVNVLAVKHARGKCEKEG